MEIACGGGYPVSRELVNAGLEVWAIDSSPTLVSEFRSRFPALPIRCESVQDSDFFARTFDGAVAVGLLFLLPAHEQAAVIARVSDALVAGGRFLFTAPTEIGTWQDMHTGIDCLSLGLKTYEHLLEEAGLSILDTYEDEGKNNYYVTEKLGSNGKQ
jgi:SAM-dependent methyltransferase